jgi:hypothetical protein
MGRVLVRWRAGVTPVSVITTLLWAEARQLPHLDSVELCHVGGKARSLLYRTAA